MPSEQRDGMFEITVMAQMAVRSALWTPRRMMNFGPPGQPLSPDSAFAAGDEAPGLGLRETFSSVG